MTGVPFGALDYIQAEGLGTLGFWPGSADRPAVHHDIVAAIRAQDPAAVREVSLRHRTS
jgi:DNA-binding FadR family transcriptional regulator